MGYKLKAKLPYATAKIAVWWDMTDCPVPVGYDARRVRPSIEAEFKKLGYCGPVSITAYCDQNKSPGQLLRGLSSTGVHVAHTIPINTCSFMYSDMLTWRSHNPCPATMMIISDKIVEVFCWDLARLQQETQYNLFLASSFEPSYSPPLATSAEWVWKRLLGSKEGTRSGGFTKKRCSQSLQEIELSASSELCKSSAGMFYCKRCEKGCESLGSFRKHLSSTKHLVKEVGNSGNGDLDPVTSMWGMNYQAKPEHATAPIMVWWDMSDCPVPEGYNPRLVRPSIEAEFEKLGYSGPVSITAWADHNKTPHHLLQGLSSTGVSIAHSTLAKISGNMEMDMEEWRDDNPPPATMMIISNHVEEDHSEYLAEEQQETKYNLFLAYSFRPKKCLSWSPLQSGSGIAYWQFQTKGGKLFTSLANLPEHFLATRAVTSLSKSLMIS